MSKKSNKIVAGYHLLTMIATSEGEIDAKADGVIREYLSLESMVRLNLDDELEQIIHLDENTFNTHFEQKAKEFYEDSSNEEREEFKLFAKDLIRADEAISKEENRCYRLLLKSWRSKAQEEE